MKWIGDSINNDIYPTLHIKIGRHSYGVPRLLYQQGDKGRSLSIGSFVSIGENVKIFVGVFGIHPTSLPSTFPIGMLYQINRPNFQRPHLQRNLDCHIGSDVWVGRDVTILAGVSIGDGAVIGAGAVVTNDIPPYAIAVGIPARAVKYRFNEQQIAKLLELRWWDLEDNTIRSLIDHFYQEDMENFIEVIGQARKNSRV